MSPDRISEQSLLGVSAWQRRAWMGMRRDLNDTIETCFEDGSTLDLYLMGYADPHYNLPVTVDDADIASNHRWITGHCPYNNPTPCWNCVAEFTDGIMFHFVSRY